MYNTVHVPGCTYDILIHLHTQCIYMNYIHVCIKHSALMAWQRRDN